MKKKTNTIGSATYQRIKHDIIFGELAPGSKLKLEALRDRYNASMSTLRETLSRLSSEGFVAAQEQRGFFVTAVSKEDLIEVAKLRVLLECHALRLSIQNGDTEWEGNLVAAHHKLHRMEKNILEGDEQIINWKRYDWEFHLAMIEACGSTNLLSLHSTLYDKYLRYQMLVLTNRGQEAVDEHRQMFEAALERNSDVAAAILKTHIEKGFEQALKAL